jgi:PAS domain S-box-containing protein
MHGIGRPSVGWPSKLHGGNVTSRGSTPHRSSIDAACDGFDLVPFALLVFEAPSWRIVHRNQAAEAIAALTPHAWSRLTLQRWLRRFRPSPTMTEVLRAADGQVDLHFRRGDRSEIATRLVLRHTQRPRSPQRIVATLRDMTERERFVAHLQESETRFRHLADHAPALVWTTDPHGRTNYFNRPWLEFTGHSLEEELRVGWSHGLHADDAERCLKTYRRQLARRETFSMLYRRHRHDGAWRWLRVNVAPLWNPARHFLGLVGICTDVTDLLDAKHAAELANEKLGLALQVGDVEPWQLDAVDLIVRPQLPAGRKSAGLLLERWLQRVPNPDRAELRRSMQALLDSGTPLQLEHRGTDSRKQGLRWYRTAARRIADETGGAPIVVGVSHDVTAQRDLERRMLEISALEKRRIGSDLHDSVGQDLTGISLLLSQCATRAGRMCPDNEAELREVGTHVRRTLEAVRALALGLCPVGVDGGGLAQSLRQLAARYESSDRWHCSVEVDGATDRHLDDEVATHLFLIAQEALSNAIRHGQATRANIRLSITSARLVLSVQDNGRGFDATEHSKSGLGLQLMQYRARMIGGIVKVQSEPAGGTCVEAQLPGLRLSS